MAERANAITMKGKPMTLVGNEVRVGQPAPDFTLTGADMQPRTLKDFAGKVKIISVVPSIDTSVCATETRRFNEEASKLGDDVVILTVSVDTPMAQKRWCAAEGVDRVVLLSDFKDHGFGNAYGCRIKELGLLARQVIVVDKNDKVVYSELVKEVANEPDYDKALEAAKNAK